MFDAKGLSAEAAETGGNFVRVLNPGDEPLLRAHLLRLDPASRRNRFNGVVDADFIARYSESCFAEGVIVLGYIEKGEVHAAAELHAPHRSADETPEIAFSVEKHLRRKGVGSALFKALLGEASRAGYARLRVTTGAQNDAMRALARKFGTKLVFRQGELSGTIDLEPVKVSSPPINPFDTGRDVARGLLGLNRAFWSAWLGSRPG